MLALIAALCVQGAPKIDQAAVRRLVERCRDSHAWSLVVLRDGKTVVKEDFGHTMALCNLMSATKSITSIAIGMLIDEGKIPSVDTKVQHFFPKYKGKWKDQVTIRHLLEHTSGIRLYQDDGGKGDSMPEYRVASALAAPIITKPGTEFAYNNRGVDLLSGIVRKAAGVPLDQYLNKRLFQPLGIAFFQWDCDPDGNPHGCAELHLFGEDAAKIGQLMLQGGVWHGKRLISKKYIEQATKPSKITLGKGDECGWLWWICEPNFVMDSDWREKLHDRFVWPKAEIEKLAPLVGQRWPNVNAMAHDMMELAGGVPHLFKVGCEVEFSWEVLAKFGPRVEGEGYFADGWGGQRILILPKHHMVAVRTGGDGFFDTDDGPKYEVGDFYRLVRDLYKD